MQYVNIAQMVQDALARKPTEEMDEKTADVLVYLHLPEARKFVKREWGAFTRLGEALLASSRTLLAQDVVMILGSEYIAHTVRETT
jgi:hypothetical protein